MSEDRLAETRAQITEMIAKGWSASAIASLSGISPITVGNLRGGKAQRVTEQVSKKIAALRARIENGEIEMPKRGRKAATAGSTLTPGVPGKAPLRLATKAGKPARGSKPPAPTAEFHDMISTRYVPVDIEKLQGMIDRLIARFTAAAEELEAIKSQLKL